MGRRDLGEAQSRRVLTLLQQRLDLVHAGNQTSLARELKMSQPALWELLNDRTKPSLATADALARASGVVVESILYSPREHAAALAREIGVPARAIQQVLAESDDAVPRPVLHYTDRMRAVALLGLDIADHAAHPESAIVPVSPPAPTPVAPSTLRAAGGARRRR